MLSTICGIILLILCLIAAVDILGSGKPAGTKVLWLLLIFLLPLIGVILYYLLGRGK